MKRQLTHEKLDALEIPRGDNEGTYKIGFRRDLAAADGEFEAKYGKCRLTSIPMHAKN